MWIDPTSPLILASASPRRRALLEQMQVPLQQVVPPKPPGEDEPRLPNESVTAYVQRTAQDKLQQARDHLSLTHPMPADALPPMLAADTTVAMAQSILGKPIDAQQACEMLQALSGRTHRVYTAIELYANGQHYRALSISSVRFGEMTPAQIDAYVATGEPFGKAGGYAIQGVAAQYIAHIEGSFSGVMGLPLFETAALLRQAGLMR
jgi:septum formation protein